MDATAVLGPLTAGRGGPQHRDAPATLAAALGRAADRWPERAALEAPSGRWRYAELAAGVDRTAAELARDLGSGEVVAALLADDALLAALPFVASRLRATALLLPTAHGDAALAAALATARPAALLADATTRRRAERLVGPDGPVVRTAGLAPAGERHVAAGHDLPAVADIDRPGAGDHDVVWLTTSGSTGMPKLVRLTERGLVHAAAGYLDVLPLSDAERSLAVMPLTYVGPLTAQTVLMPLIGGCLVVAGDRAPGAVADRMAAEAITHVDAVPTWLARAAAALDRPLPAWRALVYGGASAPVELVAALIRAQPHLALLDAWGLAEASGPVAARRADRAGGGAGEPAGPAGDPAGCAGAAAGRPADDPAGVARRPWSGVTVRAVDDAGQPVTDTPGELQVAGATVTPGYVTADGANPPAPVGPHGWLATGDLGTVGADGGVVLRDRRRDVVLRGGATVASTDVEAVLRRVQGVADAAVVAVDDAVAGEAVAAVVVPAAGGGIDAATLRARVRAELGPAAVPRTVAWRAALPLGATGKVDKAALRAELTP